MTLVYDQKKADQPGIHVLIIGVSYYHHLPGGSGTPTSDHMGMRQLSSTAISAFRFYQWLMSRKDRLALPLASVRILLSPSQKELDREPELRELIADQSIDRAVMDKTAEDIYLWRDAASDNRDNYTFFYFAGHGIKRSSRDDAVMMLEDFGQPRWPLLKNTLELRNILDGMTPCPTRPTIAGKQLYFADCCRNTPTELRRFNNPRGDDVLDVELNEDIDYRSCNVYYAAVPGAKAPADGRGETFFNQALIQSLNTLGGTYDDENEHWKVSSVTLSTGLSLFEERLNRRYKSISFNMQPMMGKECPLHYLDGPPEVDVELHINPAEAIPLTQIELIDPHRTLVMGIPYPLAPHPFPRRLVAGTYEIRGVPTDSRYPPYIKSRTVKPDTHKLEIKLV